MLSHRKDTPEYLGRSNQAHLEGPVLATPVDLLGINVVYTGPEATAAAFRVAEALARGLEATVHVRAAVSVPYHLSVSNPLISLSFLQQLLCGIIERFASTTRQYVLHVYLCRNRIETLLKVLRPSSVLVIGGRRRLWPTAEGRLSKAAISAGHSVAFVDARAF